MPWLENRFLIIIRFVLISRPAPTIGTILRLMVPP